MTTMLDNFLADIIANPADDAPRLIFADWLEENDRVEEVPCPACTPYADEPCPDCSGNKGDYRIGGGMTGEHWYDCPTCHGSGKFPPGYHPKRDPASGRREGGYTNCKECNGRSNKDAVRPGVVRRANGYAARAELIRVQVELEPLRCWQGGGELGEPVNDQEVAELKRFNVLRRREREIIDDVTWKPFPGLDVGWYNLDLRTKTSESAIGVRFRRGFVAKITCFAADWLTHADAITACTPLERVRLTTWFELRIGGIHEPGHPPVMLPDGSISVAEDSYLSGEEYFRILIAKAWPRITFTFPDGSEVGPLAKKETQAHAEG